MNCPHCGKNIEDGNRVGTQTSEKRKASSKEKPLLGNGNLSAVPDWMSPDAWNGYLEINYY